MGKFYFLIASLIVAIGATANADDNVTRLKTSSEYRKAIEAKFHARKAHAGVTRVAEGTVELPWFENFDDEASFDNFTVIDANDDFATWEYSEGKAQYFSLFADGVADDWLITPGFEMVAGKDYQISFRANSFDESSSEEFSAWLGNDVSAEAMTIEVVGETIVAQDNALDFNISIKVPEDGVYYLGFHCTSDPEEAWYLEIDDISVKEGATAAAPDAVTGLTITPDPEGALKATITFTTPAVATDGSALASLTKVEIYREDTNLIKTFDNPAPGVELTYIDESPANGDNHYTVIAYNEAGEGKPAMFSLFVGEDIPGVPQNIKQSVDGADVVLTWESEPLGWNSHYVNVSKLTYDIWETADGINLSEVAKGVTGTTYRIEGRAEQGKQQQNIYVVRAISSAGPGSRGYSNTVILGQSLALPFKETFADKKMSSRWFQNRTDSNDGTAIVDADYDGDGGAMTLSGHQAGCVVDLYSSKVWIKGESKLQLSFWYHSPADATFSAGLSKDFEDLKMVELEAADEWKQAVIDLSDMTTNDYVQILFRYVAGSEPCAIDHVELSTATTVGINAVESSADITVVERFSIDGKRVDDSYRGVVIERLSDGTYIKRAAR